MGELKVKLPPEIPVEEARLLLAMKLYETGRLSLEQAAELAGCSERVFVESLDEHGTDENSKPEKKRFSLEGIFNGDWQVTDQDFEEVKKIWRSRELP